MDSKIYKWSDNYFIRTIQKLIFYTITSIFTYFVCQILLSYFGLNIFSFLSLIYCDGGSEGEDDENTPSHPIGEETNNNDEQKNVVKVDRFVDEHDKEYYKFEGKVETNMVNQITNKIVDGVVEGVALLV